jgi:hypothetical protein
MIEMKYDTYYEKEIYYKLDYTELQSVTKDHGCLTEEFLIAYIRFKGKDFRCRAKIAVKGMMSPLGLMCSIDDEDYRICRLCTSDDGEKFTDASYNPLIEKDNLREGAWYHAYKLSITPADEVGIIDNYYVSDFVSLIEEGHIQVID